ncbi:uncharacterized protein LOC120778960 [Bactrocera tryoni]|uniref:uncharacterized protein LOC120778960 n=1 Tax=Bactrocera tryoni TaxID=59916 RepID=UPI001A957E35|nr:uncharacterized protein LOC120778960 [Bactrocera tryoni]
MLHNSPALKMRKAISLDTKIKILDQLATGQGATVVGNNFGIHEATLRTIKKNETVIRASVCSGTKLSAKSSSYVRDVESINVSRKLIQIHHLSQNNMHFPQVLVGNIVTVTKRDRPILKASLIREGLDFATKLGSHFEQHDHDEERAAKFQRELKSLMASYRKFIMG